MISLLHRYALKCFPCIEYSKAHQEENEEALVDIETRSVYSSSLHIKDYGKILNEGFYKNADNVAINRDGNDDETVKLIVAKIENILSGLVYDQDQDSRKRRNAEMLSLLAVAERIRENTTEKKKDPGHCPVADNTKTEKNKSDETAPAEQDADAESFLKT